jgi:hypothetical protein
MLRWVFDLVPGGDDAPDADDRLATVLLPNEGALVSLGVRIR